MDHRDILLNLFLGNEIEGGTGQYLPAPPRHRDSWRCRCLARAAPLSSVSTGRGWRREAMWQGIRFTASLVLAAAAAAWFWRVALENTGAATATVDLLYAQDVALSPLRHSAPQ